MTFSTRTSEALAYRCPICGCEGQLEPAPTAADAPCASCGELFWWCRQHLAELMEVPAEAITPETDLEHDLGADSLDIVELVMEVEERFDIQVADEEAVKRMRTVADAVRYIQSQTERRTATAR